MQKILISACLLGQNVRYHGGNALYQSPILEIWHKEGRLVPLCPETLAGLQTPRPSCEITRGDGYTVLEKRRKYCPIPILIEQKNLFLEQKKRYL